MNNNVLQADGHFKSRGVKLRKRPFPEPQQADDIQRVRLDKIRAFERQSLGEGTEGKKHPRRVVGTGESEYGPTFIVELSGDSK